MAKTDPNAINAILQSARMAHQAGNFEEAEAGYRRILAMNPGHPDALYHLGLIAVSVRMFTDAIDLFERAVALDPKNLNYHLELARAHRETGHHQDAVKVFERARKIAPNEAIVLAQLADVLKLTGDYEKAIDLTDQALVLFPRVAQLFATKVTALARLGRHKEAEAVCREAFQLAKDAEVEPPLLISVIFAQIAPQLGLEDEAIERLEKGLQQENTRPEDRMSAYFALGTIEDSRSNHEAAFEYYRLANTALPSRWNADNHSRLIDSLINAYSPERVASMRRSRSVTETPVFIVGMPRSGTSLVEQILAAHPDVVAFGELLDIWDAARRLSRDSRTQYMTSQFMDAVSVNMLDDAAKRYTARFRSGARGATRVTDKLPTNFLNVGLIAQMLPGARVIHCVRDPMDTCWSNYAMHFTNDQSFARNLTDLGRYCRDQQRLMDHFKQVLDLPILEVRYEELVEDTEGQSRRMLEFLDLEWNDQVLRYYEQDRRILTASADQANKPVYDSSIGRHKPYLPMLSELKAALEHGEVST